MIMSLILAALLLAVPAAAQTTWTIEGTGPLPTLRPAAPPPIVPPPVTPPVVVPPPPVVPPITDHTPFVFLPQPPPDDIIGRRFIFGLCPEDGMPCYASLPEFSSPLPYSHGLACILPAGMRWKGLSLMGMRLWMPHAWATSAPAKIRTLCAGGAL